MTEYQQSDYVRYQSNILTWHAFESTILFHLTPPSSWKGSIHREQFHLTNECSRCIDTFQLREQFMDWESMKLKGNENWNRLQFVRRIKKFDMS